mmetsp:Transcript_9680/g.17082  ORF Transcript_9680/g.17082 Transcript_9680/m.17082 type:complete len:95 (-) Transcript_9680:360-644(-)
MGGTIPHGALQPTATTQKRTGSAEKCPAYPSFVKRGCIVNHTKPYIWSAQSTICTGCRQDAFETAPNATRTQSGPSKMAVMASMAAVPLSSGLE